MQEQAKKSVPHVDEIVATVEGRRAVTRFTTSRFEHIPAELLAHQVVGLALRPRRYPSRRSAADGTSRRRRSSARSASSGELPIHPHMAGRSRALPATSGCHARSGSSCRASATPQLDVPLETAELIVGFHTLSRADLR